MLIEEVHSRLCPLIGDRHRAAHDLTTVFAGLSRTPYVRTLRRWHARSGRARINDPRLWAVRFELSSWKDGLHVAYRVHGAARRRPRVGFWFLRGYSFYAWLPDLAEAWPSVFAPAPAPPVKVELVGTTKVQLVEKPTPRAKAQSPAQVASKPEPQPSTPRLTDAQIEKWLNDASVPRAWREIRRFAVKEFGDWRSVSTAAIIKAARDSAEFKKRVRPFPSENTFNRALDRKRS